MFKNFRLKLIFILAALFCAPLIALAQNPVAWSLESKAKGKSLKANEKFQAKLVAQIEENWHLYAVEQPEGGPFPTKITISDGAPFQIDGKTVSPAPITKLDPNFQIETKFFERRAEFDLPLVTKADAQADNLTVNVKYQVCDDKICLPPKTVKVSFGGFEDVKRSGQQGISTSESQISNSKLEIRNPKSEIRNPNDLPLSNFIWLAVTLGALSLIISTKL
jgi:hypothetical protein